MDNIVDIRVLIEHLVERRLVCDVDLVKSRSLAADKFDAIDDFNRGIVEVVYDNDLVVGFKEGKGREGANVAGATESMSVSVRSCCAQEYFESFG